MDKKISVGIVGLGQFGRGFVPIFKAHPMLSRVAVCDIDKKKLESVSKEFKIQETFPSLDDICKSNLDAIVIIEELAKVDPSIALTVASHNSLCTGHIMAFGTDDQKRKFVPDLASGRKLGAWGLTPGSGSDSGGMRTTATREGDSWVISGSKTFITQGSVGSTYVILALSDPGAGKKGISAFILERGMKGFSVGRKENKLGMRCSDTATLLFDQVQVGRRLKPSKAKSFFPLHLPLMTRKRSASPSSSVQAKMILA